MGTHEEFENVSRNDHDQPRPMRHGHHVRLKQWKSTSFSRVDGVVIRGVPKPMPLALVWHRMEPESAVDQPHDEPSDPNNHRRTHIRVTSDAEPIPTENKDVLLSVLTTMVPVTVSLQNLPLLPPRVIVIANATIPARSDDMK